MKDAAFPSLAFQALGYESVHHGQGQWNGVAILSRVGIDDPGYGFDDGIEPDPDARLIAATCGGVRVHSVYVPNGRAVGHDHYHYKLSWLDRLRSHLTQTAKPSDPVVVAGDTTTGRPFERSAMYRESCSKLRRRASTSPR